MNNRTMVTTPTNLRNAEVGTLIATGKNVYIITDTPAGDKVAVNLKDGRRTEILSLLDPVTLPKGTNITLGVE